MMIYEMTATFGKLQHERLTLKPGLNIIEAPNEWGKSTWCAFLAAMLYGLDTRAKTTKSALADKEHYQPWSGAPMSGRMDLEWQGRRITIERRTRGRIPLGEFRAYETESGLTVPELNAENCGEMLLGVEQSVYRRAGFIRLADLPITKNEDLSRRLNALVTTGDESGDGERLASSLRELKNRCRYNRTGLLPQAELERDRLWQVLEEQKAMKARCEKQQLRLQQAEGWIGMLENHLEHLKCSQAQQSEERIAQARDKKERAEAALQRMEGICGELPAQEEAKYRLQKLRGFVEQWNQLMEQRDKIPQEGQLPQPPKAFYGMSPEEANAAVAEDIERWHALQNHTGFLWLLGTLVTWAAAGLLAVAAIEGFFPPVLCWIIGAGMGLIGLGLLTTSLVRGQLRRHGVKKLTEKYESDNPSGWQMQADQYRRDMDNFLLEKRKYQSMRKAADQRMLQLKKVQASLCGGHTMRETIRVWQDVARCWQNLENAKLSVQQARTHLEDLETMAQNVVPPDTEDSLSNTEEETLELLKQVREEVRRLQENLSQYRGRIQAQGEPEVLQKRYEQVQLRIRKLEEIYSAVTLAQANLEAASAELQRRFAPRISARAEQLMGRMTEGRYSRLTMGDDFTLGTGAETEDTLHSVLWRSDGTADQIYLALRLAVSETLTPDAPLVLDDALVRFDENRLEEALKILLEAGDKKQVILFTCQDREQKATDKIQVISTEKHS